MGILDTTGIRNFYDRAQREDFARDFQMRLLQLGNVYSFEDDIVYVTTTTLPNRQINNQAVPYMGLSFNVPGSVSYPGSDGWAVTFRCGQNYVVRHTLEKWQRMIFDDRTSTGTVNVNVNGYNTPLAASTISLGLIDKVGDVIRQYDLIGVYPIAIGDIAYDTTGPGAPVTFTTTLAYQYWTEPSGTTASFEPKSASGRLGATQANNIAGTVTPATR